MSAPSGTRTPNQLSESALRHASRQDPESPLTCTYAVHEDRVATRRFTLVLVQSRGISRGPLASETVAPQSGRVSAAMCRLLGTANEEVNSARSSPDKRQSRGEHT
jgi:hypothetical protein